jgi:hypothetical protein
MNRWRARLAELRSDTCAPPVRVQNVQNVQNPFSGPDFEQFEQFEQLTEPAPATQSDVWTDAQEERAAIIQYDGGAPRAWAEAVARLDQTKPPSGVSPHRWQRFIDDCGRFLDGGWADKAAALGWGPLQLFGCDRKQPYHVPHRGLLWEVNGGTVVDLRRDRAIIEINGGARRSHSRVGRIVLAWELTQ